jgi:hypothetical protein
MVSNAVATREMEAAFISTDLSLVTSNEITGGFSIPALPGAPGIETQIMLIRQMSITVCVSTNRISIAFQFSSL